MNSIGKTLRTSAIFRDDGRTLIFAMDHGGYYGPLPGIEKPRETLVKVIGGGADAVMINYGMVKQCLEVISGKIACILSIPPDVKYVKKAVKIGAHAIKCGYFGPLENCEKYFFLGSIALECERWEMPFLCEIVPMNSKNKVLHTKEAVEKAARIGAEFGADFMKIPYTGSPVSFKEVVESATIPSVIMGGEKMDTDKDVLETVNGSVEGGGCGVAFGRNIFQHRDPAAITRAIAKIIHEDSTVEEALKEVK